MNEDKVFVLNEPIYGQKLANIFSTLVLNFTKYGNPNNKYLPQWETMSAVHHHTMIIDRECICKEGHDEELVALFDQTSPKISFNFI